ncbi:uncharacterized protein C8A04DRAFT_11198 [Dichotomopilus funicola]|uniref:DJ-1/PfpI domain-containing protein n=1 Tax=Dichotomopilus funicola TaxID=1934379 RepID=A0AAN6V643_9PEZI|nr:hypothetical protein C8A04DRAFT_11198 [Dichotomopilus funicola]
MAVIESRPKIRIGVFIPTDCQLLDMACVDIFGTMSYEYLTIVKDLVPGPLMNLAPSVEISCNYSPTFPVILHISVVQPGELIRLTSSASVACTHHFSDPKMQPGMLDIVFVPGPDPAVDYSNLKDALDWLTAHAAHPGTDILSVCTGAYLCGAAGVFNGKKASGPRGVQGDLEKKFPDVKWVGGVTNGNDLVAAYARTTSRFPGPVVELALMATDTGDRAQRYDTGKTAVTLGVLWQVLKAMLMGVGKTKEA